MTAAALMIVLGADVSRVEVGPLRIEVAGPAREIGLDDPLKLQITIQYPPNVSVEASTIKSGSMLDSALVADVRLEGPDRIEGKFGPIMVSNWSLTMEPTKVGTLSPPKLGIRYQEKGKPIATAELVLPSFEVKPGNITAGPNDDLKLPPPLTEEKRADLAWWMKAVGGIGLALCLLALAWTAKSELPADAVRKAIEKEAGEPRAAISRICDHVRSHLQTRHGISAAHLTTPELLADEQLLSGLPGETRRSLAELLPMADMLRFPQPKPTPADLEYCRAAALRAVAEPAKV
jgi:hypothetical protein